MGKLFLEVVTPEKVLVSQEIDTVVAPGTEGEFGILPGHINFLSGIVPGELRFSSENNQEHMMVSAGFAEVSADKVSILVDSAEKAVDIDLQRAENALERAKSRLKKEKGTEDVDFLRAELALKRAISRIKVAQKSD
ncbi:F0F1 ATP synthase subunit epsilon [Thermodesulfobacteriota bacterium]